MMPPSSRLQSIVAELKRRRVFRVMTVYGIVGFGVLQVADLLLPVLLLPDWTYRLLGTLLLAGFPVAIALAWVFEWTPEGVRRTSLADEGELAGIVAAPRRQHWPAGLLALAGTGLLVAGYALGDGRSAADPQAADSGTPSLAVLPFTNMARSEESEPFVAGVHDDLLTQLSRIEALHVISRTSVLNYRNTTLKIRDIANELGVDHVLEGGVQRSGDQVRINVQLIDARTDKHLWAETYNRTLSVANVFAIQSEIAEAIASALSARLSSAERQGITARPTDNLEAYDHYQRGLASFRRTLAVDGVRMAVGEFEAALRIDPDFADAWAQLAIARLTLSWDFGLTEESRAAEVAVRRAEALAPDRPLTLVARGYYYYYGRREYDAALAALRKAEALTPTPEVLLPAGWVLRRQRRWEEALEKFKAAFVHDPRNWDNAHASLGNSLLVLRRYTEAERYLELATSIAPDLAASYSHLALLPLMQSGDTAAAAAAVERGSRRADAIRILIDFPAVARTLAYRFAPLLRAATSAVANDTSGLQTEWLGDEITTAAFFLQKAQMLRALGAAAEARAHFDSARVVLEPKVRRFSADAIWSAQGSELTSLGVAYAALGRKQDAIRYGQQGLASALRLGDAVTAPMRRAHLAEIYVVVGEPELALDELERLLAAPGMVSAALLRVDPLWTPLRTHPRFQKMLQDAAAASAR